MNLSEFKAWFEGFAENLEGPPTEKQWARITDKIGQIKDAPPVAQHVFHDHYYRTVRRWYEEWPRLTYLSGQNASASPLQYPAGLSATVQAKAEVLQVAAPFNSGAAFRDLGRAEALSMST